MSAGRPRQQQILEYAALLQSVLERYLSSRGTPAPRRPGE